VYNVRIAPTASSDLKEPDVTLHVCRSAVGESGCLPDSDEVDVELYGHVISFPNSTKS